jgi:hypothetical protein
VQAIAVIEGAHCSRGRKWLVGDVFNPSRAAKGVCDHLSLEFALECKIDMLPVAATAFIG